MNKCGSCGGSSIYQTSSVAARGGHGPDLLPGLGRFFSAPKLKVYVCSDCGYVSFFAEQDARDQLASSHKWKRVSV